MSVTARIVERDNTVRRLRNAGACVPDIAQQLNLTITQTRAALRRTKDIGIPDTMIRKRKPSGLIIWEAE